MKRVSLGEIAPDEVLLDSHNLPKFDVYQFQGRLERPISRKSFFIAGAVFLLIALLLAARNYVLEIRNGEAYEALSERNSLHRSVIFAPRGLIADRSTHVHPVCLPKHGAVVAHVLCFYVPIHN